ncbi:MAG: peptidoglycan -binding protein, partial [Pararhodobacter sp.]|nr:peptidoglycan -binding protein [Pararhodobacter sp.]
ARLEAELSAEQIARQQALAELAETRDRAVAQLSEAERARLAEATAAEALRMRLAQTEGALSAEEQRRLADLAAAEALRARLQAADAELTSMTLALEAQRQRAEETLTLLAAAQEARDEALDHANRQLTESETRAALLRVAAQQLSDAEAASAEDRRRLALLNEQVAQLQRQVAGLQELLGESRAREVEADTQIETMTSDLNAALARVAAEERRRAELEEAERRRLEAEARQLERYRSEFFGQMRAILDGRDGVRIVGDRFVFSSEVLFEPGSADLAREGRIQIANVVAILSEVAREIPSSIDWILRVDGHTDNVPIPAGGTYASNWELSQARALSVVLYLIEDLDFAPDRLAAAGFGEYRPVAEGNSPEARAQNRRIELKLTER